MTINSFRDLRVWQIGMELVEQIYRLTQLFPNHEQFGLTSQLRRSAISIPSNIAEGHVREYLKEYLYHVSVAQGSLAELQTQVEIAERLSYLPHDQSEQILKTAESLSRQLYALRNSLSRRG
ncbi:MAG TPA: four helix bundle protein [Roseiflexaceae bacterium]|nr:four helix bundle protein [Roseiflexaceae bacterium]